MSGFLPFGRTGNHGPAAFQMLRARAARFRHFCSGLFRDLRCENHLRPVRASP